MIFRLEYKNKALKTARVDIVTPTGTGVETVEGTGYPFQLKYEGDKKNKGLMFLSSSAEINIYETPLFNIDTLKTSGEKDIRVNYYIDSVLEWTGFVIPDFFSREIGGDGVVSMVASDRLSVLDSEVLEGLPVTVTLRTLLSSCLAKTGLTLPLKSVVDFAISGTAQRVLDYKIRSQRLTDTKGRSVNCKDIIKSILVATNSKIMQRKGEWWVINKMQHELGGGRVYTSPTAFTNYVEDLISFTDVTRGAMRTIAPVAGGVGVFQEYGGGKLIPDNYNFKNGLTGWTNYNGFVSSTNNRRVLGYTQSGNVYTPIYDVAGTSEPYLVNRNISPLWVLYLLPGLSAFDPYAIRSTRIVSPVVSGDSSSAKATVEINAVGRNGTHLPFTIALKRPGRQNLFLNRNNEWERRVVAQLLSFKNEGADNLAAVSAGMSVSAVISAESSGEVLDDVGSYTIEVLIFGSGLQGDNTVDNTTLINSASVQFSAASNDTPKGTLYKADQGGESYTKIHDTETTVFGDYLTGGLNGYFYNYAPDDTSSLLAPNGSRSQPAWVNTYTQNTEPLPLLQQTIRQMRRMFSVAHDFIKGEIDVADFDPLSIFEDCERRFVIVEAEFDFLRGSLQVVLEEVAYQNLTVREYIYSYFGEGDEGIRGISGISAGSSGGGGGGMAPEPSWLENEITIDPESGLLSVDGWHVKGNLIIEGQVNQWLAQQLVVDDARIQVNRRQGGATVDSGLVIYNKDTSSEVSSLVYDVDGIWRADGQRIYTNDYNPMLGGYSAASYPRKAEDAVITGAWKHTSLSTIGLGSVLAVTNEEASSEPTGAGLYLGRTIGNRGVLLSTTSASFGQQPVLQFRLWQADAASYSNIPIVASLNNAGSLRLGSDQPALERLHVTGNGLFTGAVTAGGNVGTSNFASQSQGWRVTPAGVADFRHIYTDELQAKAFTADISQALVGSDVLTKSVAKLAQNWATTANGATSTIYVEELEGFPGFQVFAVGDRLLLRLFDRTGGGLLIKNIWATVASYVSTTNNVQRYTITVNSGGATGHTVYAGSMILDYGTSGSGVIERTVLDAMGSPYSQVKTWVNDPSNPANYTIHNRTGNLDGIANASGFGFYGENTFLTGKLLVGDLTKVGQYMEYENGQLNIKGQITVTGGNAATKADVDAVQVGGRNLLEKTNQGTDGWAWSLGTSGASATRESVVEDGVNTVKLTRNTVANSSWSYIRYDYIGREKYKPSTEYTLSFFVKSSVNTSFTGARLQTGAAQDQIIVFAQVQIQAVAGEWSKIVFKGTSAGTLPSATNQVVYLSGMNSSPGVTYQIKDLKLELGNRATDWTPAPEDVDAGIAAAESAAKSYTDDLTSRVETTLGLADLENINQTLITGNKIRTSLLEVTDIVAQGITAEHVEGLTLNFKKGTIGGIAIDDSRIFTENWELNKDGSFYFGAGGEIDGGLITGNIESQNWDGTVGSSFDLNNGRLLIGDAIRMSGDVSEIQVKDRDTGLSSFKIGDFALTPTDFTGAGVDVSLSSSPVTTSASAGSYQITRTVYVSGYGAFLTSAAKISDSLIVGGAYNFFAYLKVALSPNLQVETTPYSLRHERYERTGGNGIKMQLKNGNTVVWEQNISTIPENGVIPLSIATPFQAVSSLLQLIITIDGEYQYLEPYGSETRIYNTTASIGRFDSSSRLVLQALIARMEFSTKGMQAVFSTSNYFRVDASKTEGRGNQTFISPNGAYRLRVSNTGIEKSTDGGSTWTNV